MVTILTAVYVLVCFGLIITVLLQSAKGEGLAGAFGGGGGVSGAVFGGRGAASFLSRATTVLAVMFMLLAIVLSFMGGGTTSIGGQSAVQKAAQQPTQAVPATDVPGAEPVNPAAEGLFEIVPGDDQSTTPAEDQTTAPADDQTTTPAEGLGATSPQFFEHGGNRGQGKRRFSECGHADTAVRASGFGG